MGTPTYSIPAWMYKEHPEIVVRKLDGQRVEYGLRQNMDTPNPTYRFYCERVIRKSWNTTGTIPPSSGARSTTKPRLMEPQILMCEPVSRSSLNILEALNYRIAPEQKCAVFSQKLSKN